MDGKRAKNTCSLETTRIGPILTETYFPLDDTFLVTWPCSEHKVRVRFMTKVKKKTELNINKLEPVCSLGSVDGSKDDRVVGKTCALAYSIFIGTS